MTATFRSLLTTAETVWLVLRLVTVRRVGSVTESVTMRTFRSICLVLVICGVGVLLLYLFVYSEHLTIHFRCYDAMFNWDGGDCYDYCPAGWLGDGESVLPLAVCTVCSFCSFAAPMHVYYCSCFSFIRSM